MSRCHPGTWTCSVAPATPQRLGVWHRKSPSDRICTQPHSTNSTQHVERGCVFVMLAVREQRPRTASIHHQGEPE